MKPQASPPSVTPSPSQTPLRSRQPWLAWILVAVCIGLPAFLLYEVVSCFGLGSDAAVLRDALQGRGGIELRLGALPLGVVRSGIKFVDVDPEVTLALSAVRAVECGVYSARADADPADLLPAGDAAMKGRGWSRVVGVVHEGTVVGVYSRDGQSESDDLDLCAVVRHEDHVFVAGLRCRVAPLLELAGEKAGMVLGASRPGLSAGRPRLF